MNTVSAASPGPHRLHCTFARGPRPDVLLSLGHGDDGGQAPLRLPMAVLDGGAVEHWHAGPVRRIQDTGAALCHADDDWLVLAWQLDEQRCGGLEGATRQVYRELGELPARLGYPQMLKIWHYFADINAGSGDDERYRRFCVARAAALPSWTSLPAATAIGTPAESPFTVFALASRQAGTPLENPRQVSAFAYPRQYGPASPSFSRAMLCAGGELLVSGTAAVVGHQSQHTGDVAAQLEEIARNLDALTSAAATRSQTQLHPSALKFYLRDPQDAPRVRGLIHRLFPGDCPHLLLHGQISRRELLIEVEGVFTPF